MGVIRTFRDAFKQRLEQLRNESVLGKKYYYMGKMRICYKTTRHDAYLRGLDKPVSKEFIKGKLKK